MKKVHKKGFTIVELVIVIAIIAILAAVLIPTFVNVAKRAKLSVDQQAVYEMNVVLTADEAQNGIPADVNEVLRILEEEGISAKNYTPLTSGMSFVWAEDVNRILLIDENSIVYPEEYINASQAGYWHNLATAAVDLAEKELDAQLLAQNYTVRIGEAGYTDLAQAISAAQSGDEIRLLNNYVSSTDLTIEIKSKDDVTLDLNGYMVQTLNGSYFYGITVSECNNVTIENGNVSLNNTSDSATAVYIEASTGIMLSKLFISAPEGAAAQIAVGIKEGSVEIIGCELIGQVSTYATSNDIIIIDTKISSSAPICLSSNDNLTVRGGSLNGATGYFVGSLKSNTNMVVSLEGDIELVPAESNTSNPYIFFTKVASYGPTVSEEIYERYLKNGDFAVTSSLTYTVEPNEKGTYTVVKVS